MLTRLLIKNFQAHEKLDLELDPHITAIVGPSDIGKSAIVRALRWLCLNKPQGESFRKDGTDETVVKLKVDDSIISRRRKSGENSYRTGKDNKLVSFKVDVPVPVQRILQIDELNFQCQHDPPFWFNLSPPELGRRLNDLVDLGSIDDVNTFLAKEQRNNAANTRSSTNRLFTLNQDRDNLECIKEADTDLKKIEHQRIKIVEKQESVNALSYALKKAKRTKQKADDRLAAYKDIEKILELKDGIEGVVIKLLRLEELMGKIEAMKKLSVMEVPNFSTIETLYKRESKLNRKLDGLQKIMVRIRESTIERNESNEELEKIVEEIKTKYRNICPACGGKYDPNSI